MSLLYNAAKPVARTFGRGQLESVMKQKLIVANEDGGY